MGCHHFVVVIRSCSLEEKQYCQTWNNSPPDGVTSSLFVVDEDEGDDEDADEDEDKDDENEYKGNEEDENKDEDDENEEERDINDWASSEKYYFQIYSRLCHKLSVRGG